MKFFFSFQALKEKKSLLENTNVAIVTDSEMGIIKAIKKLFPNLTLGLLESLLKWH